MERVPSDLRAGRRALEGVAGVEVFEDFVWLPAHRSWGIGIQLTITARGPRRLDVTRWYVVVEEPYPWGKIYVYPALEGGIKETFHHQRHNKSQAGLPFRSGAICVQSGLQSLDRRSLDLEPIDVHEKLRWNVERAIAWVWAASADELTLPGEPFELPDFPVADAQKIRVAFNETSETFADWSRTDARWGTLTLVGSVERRIFHVLSFDSEEGQPLIVRPWGTFIDEMPRTRRGVWLRLDGTPALEPWRAPTTWSELRTACKSHGVDLDQTLRRLLPRVRDKIEHLALVGFPIPHRSGEPVAQYRWQGFLLPGLEPRPARGFRAGDRGLWVRDRLKHFGPDVTIDWLQSENWSMDDLTSRGALSKALREQRVLLIGAGALGSVIAELLVRGGVQDLVIVDGEDLEAGNLVRHTLTILDVGKPKAPALATRLNAAAPHARVRGFKVRFPGLDAEVCAFAESCTLVVDCTASDQVAHRELEQFRWGGPRVFVSLSLGFEARRLFCFVAKVEQFPSATFIEMTTPWLLHERGEHAGRELPREGVGCWSPVFPARFDDIWSFAALGLKRIERAVSEPPPSPDLVVLESNEEGYRRAVIPA